MQNIQKHPMVSVKEAAAALGIDERTVREKLSNQDWKGEKKSVGLKEKWFMYRGELERQLDRLGLSRPEDRVSMQGMDTVFDTNPIDAEVSEPSSKESFSSKQDYPSDQLERIVKTITTTITEPLMQELAQQRDTIIRLQREVADKDIQLRLLPDLKKEAEKQREAAELKHFEADSLRKQIQMLQKPWWQKFFGKPVNQPDRIVS